MATNNKDFSCKACGKRFDSNEALERHVKDVHPVKGVKKRNHVGRLVLVISLVLIIVWVAFVVYMNPLTIVVERVQHIRGNESAPVTMTEFSDFECSFCAAAEPVIGQVLKNYTDKVRLVYRQFPLHPYSMKAAEASECAGEQGKFWEYHDVLFNHQEAMSVDNLKGYAKGLGLNTTAFDSCLDSGVMSRRVQADFDEGDSKGVTGTPTFFINGSKVVGAQPFSVFQTVIDKTLAGG